MSYFIGVDVGSSYSKAVILSGKELVSFHIIPSGGNYALAADNVIAKALKKAELSPEDITGAVATGYGSSSVSINNRTATDISCHGRGIFRLFPSARTVIDIGGQFSRAIRLDDRGRNVAFLMSEKCAGGSGRFLQVIAHVLRLDLDEVGPLSLKSKDKVNFNTGCAVFAETEAISRIAEGAAVEDILAGVHSALASRIQSLVSRLGMQPDVALTGGGAKDIGLVRSIEQTLDTATLVPEEPQISAALGAALIAGDIG